MKMCHARGQLGHTGAAVDTRMYVNLEWQGWVQETGITRCGLYLDLKCIDLTLQLGVWY